MSEKKTSKEKVLTALKRVPISWTALWTATELNEVTLVRAVNALLDEGKIRRIRAGGAQISFELTNPPK